MEPEAAPADDAAAQGQAATQAATATADELGPSLADDITVANGVWCLRLDDRVDCRSFGTEEVSVSLAGSKRDVWFVSGGVCASDASGAVACAAWQGRPLSRTMKALQSLPPIADRSDHCLRDASGAAHVIRDDRLEAEPGFGRSGALVCGSGHECVLAEGQLRCLWPRRGGDAWMQPFTESIVGAVEPERLAGASITEVYLAPHIVCMRSSADELFCRSSAEFTDGAIYEVTGLRGAAEVSLAEHGICGTTAGEVACVLGAWWKPASTIPQLDDVARLRPTRHFFVAHDRTRTVSFIKVGRRARDESVVPDVDGVAVGTEAVCLTRGREVACFVPPARLPLSWVSI